MDHQNDDVQAIKAVIDRQFSSLAWSGEKEADWSTFAADFAPEAALYPAARPVIRQSVPDFIERMKEVANLSLRSFHERTLGTRILIFGKVAIAMAGCEQVENDNEVNCGVEAMLLIKDQDRWKIVAQAWDIEDAVTPIPIYLVE